ncbi:hypothetical protein HHI36_015008 [Cryptolaemus montrouzieri]|uniref:Uncharacterized protein n=1 Tax=Cryptolaemus montrouzieri TaxID=559131 RepID=A0ABD2N5K8_9CUCU
MANLFLDNRIFHYVIAFKIEAELAVTEAGTVDADIIGDHRSTFCSISVKKIFNVHAPVKTMRVSRPKAPWMNDEVRNLVKLRTASLSWFNRSGSEADWVEYKPLRNSLLSSIRRSKRNFLYESVREGQSSAWGALRSLHVTTSGSSNADLPSGVMDPDALNKNFSQFYEANDKNCGDLIHFYSNSNSRSVIILLSTSCSWRKFRVFCRYTHKILWA